MGARMNSLLPPGSSPLERRLAQTCSGISDLQVSLRDLWNPATCPIRFLPYLAWAFSVDRWMKAGQKASSAALCRTLFISISTREQPVPCGVWWSRSAS